MSLFLKILWIYLLFLLISAVPLEAEAAGIGKRVYHGVARKTLKSNPKMIAQVMQRDLKRDQATKAVSLTNGRTVHRYVSTTTARKELHKGIPPQSHMTSRATPGRPLSVFKAQRQFGLSKAPKMRETIKIQKGQPVRFNKVLGGGRGKGEITSSRSIPPESIRKVVPLH